MTGKFTSMDPAIYYFIAAVLVIVGLAGTVLPVIPGAVLIFAGLFLAAQADGFRHVGWFPLAIIAVLAVLSWVADFVASLLGAKRVGASPLALLGAAIGGIAGIFLGIPGLIFGPFIGAALGEILARRGLRQAGKVALGTWLGLVAAAVAKVVLAFLMIATFFAAYSIDTPFA
jgi:uncharacterized protein YqgC (DUF456 family)